MTMITLNPPDGPDSTSLKLEMADPVKTRSLRRRPPALPLVGEAFNRSFNDSISSIDVSALDRTGSTKESGSMGTLSSSCSNLYLDASYAGPLSGLAAATVEPTDADVSGGIWGGGKNRRRRSSLLKRGENAEHTEENGGGREGRNQQSLPRLRRLSRRLSTDDIGNEDDLSDGTREEQIAGDVAREIIEDRAHFLAMKEKLQRARVVTSLGVNMVCAEYIKQRTDEEVEMRRRSSEVVSTEAARPRPVQELRRRFSCIL